MTTMTLHDAARKAESAYNDMSFAAIELADADKLELPVEGAALNLLRKVKAKVDELIPAVERLMEQKAAPGHLWVSHYTGTYALVADNAICQRCRKPISQAAQPCQGSAL